MQKVARIKLKTMKSKDKSMYEAPRTTVVEVSLGGIVCQSGGLNNPADYVNGGDPFAF